MDFYISPSYRFTSAYGPWDSISEMMGYEKRQPRKPLSPKERERRKNRKKMAKASRKQNRKSR